MIGSTDIKVDDPDTARVDDDEIDYMIEAIGVAFPDIKVDRSQILSVFTGVRPLRKSDAATTGQMSRAHYCDVEGPTDQRTFPVYSMVGGKWTPFRGFAEMAADQVLAFFGKPRQAGTDALAIGGGKGFPAGDDAKQRWAARLTEKTGLSAARLLTLLARFGTRAALVAEFTTEAADQPLKNHAGYTRREIEFMVVNERVYHLDDLVLRRTAIALLGELTSELLSELADIAAPRLGWSDRKKNEEVARTKDILADKFRITV
jgi:glycerol-3-phosphate dehydrogenase